jgi:uncharacterized protein (DUF849 family)
MHMRHAHCSGGRGDAREQHRHEAALNGPWSRALQPGIPDTIEAIITDGIACARAGAAIIHTHAYDAGGPQTFDWQVYARIIEVGVDVTPLIGETVARGGHVRVGLEDALLGSTATNLRLVEDAVRMVREHGGEPATVTEVRQALANG